MAQIQIGGQGAQGSNLGSKRVNPNHVRKRITNDFQLLQIQQAQNHAVNSLEDSLSPVRPTQALLLAQNYNK